MRTTVLVTSILMLTLLAPNCQARGGGGSAGGGHSSGAAVSHSAVGYGTGWYHHGYVGNYSGNYNTDETLPPYQPMGPSAAGGNVDPALQRSDFVKTYYWPSNYKNYYVPTN